ncbi:MAG: hypothetical protein AAF679_09430, partial [Pseudomonadota bacterium]
LPSVPQNFRRIEAVTVGSEVVLRVSRSMWRSNGTDAGTQRLEAFDDPDVSGPRHLFAKDSFVYFSMRDAEGKKAVFRTDPALCTQGGLITAAQPHCAASTGAGSVLGANPVVSGQ